MSNDINKGYKKVVLRTENLSTKAQKTALKILNKEELSSKKSRLECLLIQQFLPKYGSEKVPNLNDQIRRIIKEYLDSFNDVLQAEAMISVLEKQIKDTSSKIKNEYKLKLNLLSTPVDTAREESNGTNHGSRKGYRSAIPRNDDENKWPIIQAILAVSEEEKRIRGLIFIIEYSCFLL